MEEKASEISGPCENFRIFFCGEIPSGSVAWYVIDVSVREACLSEKMESNTKKLCPFSVAKYFPSVYYAALEGCIYSLGGQRRSDGVGGETLLKDVWFLDFKSLDGFEYHLKPLLAGGADLKPASIPPLSSMDSDLMCVSKSVRSEHEEPQGEVRRFPSLRGEDEEFRGVKPRSEGGMRIRVEFSGEHQKRIVLRGKEDKKRVGVKLRGKEDKARGVSRGKDKVSRADCIGLGRKDEDEERIELRGGSYRAYDVERRVSLRRGKDEVPRASPLSGKDAEERRVSPLRGKDEVHRASPLNWEPGFPMNFARCNPHTMVVDHKLYVLGGFRPNQNQAHGWIEVFDPKEKSWESLPSPPDQIHSSVMISGLLKSKEDIIIAKQCWDRRPMLFYSFNIKTRLWKTIVSQESDASVRLPPNAGRAVTVGNTLYWISTHEEHYDDCIIRAYDLDRNMWFEDSLRTAKIFGDREHLSSIYSSGPGFLHLRDQKFCLLLQSTITKDDPQLSIEYLYCVILDISPIYEHENRGKFKLKPVSVQKYSMDCCIDFLDCMLVDRVSGVKSVDRRGQSTSTNISFQEVE